MWTKAKKPKDLLDNNTDGAETIEDGLEDVESEITRYAQTCICLLNLAVWLPKSFNQQYILIVFILYKTDYVGQMIKGYPKSGSCYNLQGL